MPHLQPHSRGLAASSLVTAARRRARGAVAWLAAGAVSLVAAACGAAPSPTPTDPGDTPPPDVDPVRAYAQVPASPLTQIDAPGGAERAALTAAELFAEAPAVVLDDGADSRTSLRAASTAVAIGVPVLIAGTEETFAELDRLGTEVALAFGTATLPADLGAITLVAAPQDDAALASLLDVPLIDPVPMDEGHEVSSLARLSPGTLATWEWPDPAEGPGTPGPDDAEPDGEGTEPDVGEPEPDAGEPDVGEPEPDAGDPADPPTTPGDAGESPGAEPGPTLPPLAETQRVDGVLALTRGTNEDLAAVATARAAGATVVVLDDPDPRATEAAVAQIAASDADHVLAIGDEWEGIDTLEWRLATAATGVQLPGGGQLVLPDKHYVALYGNPVTSVLGVLGEQDTAATIERASRYAAEYDDLLPGTVIPALEIIATVASASAGSTATTPPRWHPKPSPRSSTLQPRPGSTSSWICSRAARPSSSRPSSTKSSFASPTSVWRSTRNGISASTSGTSCGSVPSAPRKSTTLSIGSPTSPGRRRCRRSCLCFTSSSWP